MKEITGNLRRDVKDLLDESANIVTGVIKRGACTVRVMADKWKAFAHDLSGAVDTLMKPAFIEGRDAPPQALPLDGEPTVTVTESIDGHFPIGSQMPLSQANELVGRISREYMEAEYAIQPVTVRIDYMKDGQTDRYFLPLHIGGGGDLLSHFLRLYERQHAGAGHVPVRRYHELAVCGRDHFQHDGAGGTGQGRGAHRQGDVRAIRA